MAATFSIGEAYSAGFRVIGRHPLAPLLWGVVYALVGMAPSLLLSIAVTGGVGMFGGHLASTNPQQVAARMGSVFLMLPVQMLLGLIVASILYGAIFRAVLRPEDSRTAYLRVGGDELRLGLVILVMWLLYIILCVVMIVPVGMIMGAGAVLAARGGSPSVGGTASMVLVDLLLFLGIGAVSVWLVARFSMALPMTFATRQFRLFESWTMTRGRTWPLIGLLLLQLVTLMAVYLVLILVLLTVFGGFFRHGIVAAASGMSTTPSAAGLGGILAGYIVGAVLIAGYLMAFLAAPWADVYRQIAAPGAADHFGPAPTAAPAGSIA